MSVDHQFPVLAFVWRPNEIAPSVVDAARRTRTRAIFNLSGTKLASSGPALLHADAGKDAVELKISPDALMDAELGEFLQEIGIDNVWIELQPSLLEAGPAPYLRRMAQLAGKVTCLPIVGDVDLIRDILTNYPTIENIVIKGCEASGFVSSQTALSLYSTVRTAIGGQPEQHRIHIWGGVATPEAAAAFLSTGAKGIVFESLHWLTNLVSLPEEQRQKIANLRPEHTELVGLNIGVPCRLFNKGNSVAVRELRQFAGSLCGTEIRDEQRSFFARRIQKDAAFPLEGRFDRQELLPLGVEATFATSFVDRYGPDTEEAVNRFLDDIEALCRNAGAKEKAFRESPTAREFGTKYPFVQGAMSWITDVPEFALKVAEAGGMPTLALGLMDTKILNEKLGALREVMGERPYALNVITLAENPHRDEQLAWIRANRPRFTVIAAGEPSHAKELLESGIECIYIAPNEELLKLAFDAGVQYVICEGNEAGGHVGEHSTLTLAQIILEQKRRDPDLFKGKRIILAGGICNKETAFMAAMLGADAVQMGTGYLATREIVETGALTSLYQRMILQSAPGGTVVTGEATGLRIRSLNTPKMEVVCALEREFAAGSGDEVSFRQKIEGLTAGSLLIAARGLDKPGGTPLDDRTCSEQGQFMSGACAGIVKEVRSLGQFHQDLAEGRLAEGLPFLGPIRETAPRLSGVLIDEAARSGVVGGGEQRAYHAAVKERIAITGMSVVNSLGNSPEEVWAASLAMKSGIVSVPLSRWDHEVFYHPRPRTPEKTYCRVGAFQNIEVSRKELGIPPQDFRTMTDSTKITMWLAQKAIEESGILESDVPRERIGVLISQNSGEAAATLQDVIIRGSARDVVSSVKKVIQLPPDKELALEEQVKSGRLIIDDTTLLGRLNCAAGGFICNKYGFMGPSFSVSAACATALVALYSAYQMIRNGIIDAAVIGGAEEPLTPMHFLEFSALGALAGLSGIDRPPFQASRPFDADRDGMVLGEGGGMIVIERESLARKRGAKVHAYITSMGASNNHLGMVESSRVTQEIAIAASFHDASYQPGEVDLIECHATSTRQGDVEEVHALKKFFDSDSRTILASFKSQIGHTLGASGVNSLIRGVMAMKGRVLPPTLNYETPDPEIGLEELGFRVCHEPADWTPRNGRPRRLEINAFGFGGSNYVVQVEEATEEEDRVLVSLPKPVDSAPEESKEAVTIALPEGISFFKTEIGSRPCRMAVVAETEKDALDLIESAEPLTNGGPIPPKRLRALARQGIHLGVEDEAPPPLAFMFPGQGSHYAGMSHELYETFPVIRQWMDRAASVADFDLLKLLFYDREEDLQKTRWQQPALFTMEYAMVQYLVSLGIRPVALAGHSLGELTALCLAGVYSFEDGFRIVNMRAQCMDKACVMNVDPGVMMAVDAPLEMLEERLRSTENIYITNINSPHQVVLGGDTEAVEALGEELKGEGFRRTLLRVSMAFHSPIMKCIHDELEAFIAGIEFHAPKIPVISNTTMQPFPGDTTEIKRIVMAHLESPVHWMQNVRTLWNDYGVRLFVEVGPRDVLSNLVSDAQEGSECIQTCLPSAESLIYRTALAQLYAKGHLKVGIRPRFATFPGQAKAAGPSVSVPETKLAKGVKPARGVDDIGQIVQREINRFIIESFGRFLRPGLLETIRREHDPAFDEAALDRVLHQMLPGLGALPVSVPTTGFPSPVAGVPSEAAVEVPESSVTGELDTSNVTEAVIQIIMEATGYERDEIAPEMDLREDLSIRSSRLPVIMDSLEGHFGIKIEIEDFMDVRTIRDIADKISAVASRTEGKSPAAARKSAPSSPSSPDSSVAPVVGPSEEKAAIKRLIFAEVPLEKGDYQPIEIDTMESVTILSAAPGNGLTKEVANILRRDYGTNPIPLAFMADAPGDDGAAFDVRTENGSSLASARLSEMESLAGMVFIIDEGVANALTDPVEISRVLRGFFVLVKTFLDSSAKKFVVAIHKSSPGDGIAKLLSEGILGMFLSLAHEFSSVQFRTARLDGETDLKVALRAALDRSCKVVETIYRNGDAFTSQAHVVSSAFDDTRTRGGIRPGDVVVLSGGGYGITSHLARSLIPYGCRIIFLGRTSLDPDIDFHQLLSAEGDTRGAVRKAIVEAKPALSEDETEKETAKVFKAVEVIRTVEELRGLGIDAAYFSCDVTDPIRTRFVVDEIVGRYGKIDGIIHGAGILRDNFSKQMSAEDFSAVVDVKFLGAWNLFRAAQDSGLRFLVALSSAAAIQGNPGQANYSAANRIMSALTAYLRDRHDALTFKALMLPPIEGTGMAEDPEIRALMKRMNAAYVHVDELAGLFLRELTVASPEDVWVMFMRSLPDVPTVRLDTSEPSADPDKLEAATVTFRKEEFPMVDEVSSVDISGGELVVRRAFSTEKDLWLKDHHPFKFLKYPLVSAIMAVETFMETARILYPHLDAQGVRNVEFLDIIECPPGVERTSLISCRRVQTDNREVLCQVSLATRELSPSGQVLDRMYTNYKATVILAAPSEREIWKLAGFPVTNEELDTRSMDHAEVLEKYEERSRMQGRYRVIEELDGTARDAVRGRIIYSQSEDFAGPRRSHYQYSPYLLEALMQLANFYVVMRDESEHRSMIPYKIGEMTFFRQATSGERVTVEGRLRNQDREGIVWDARAVDEDGRPLMLVREMFLRWFSP